MLPSREQWKGSRPSGVNDVTRNDGITIGRIARDGAIGDVNDDLNAAYSDEVMC